MASRSSPNTHVGSVPQAKRPHWPQASRGSPSPSHGAVGAVRRKAMHLIKRSRLVRDLVIPATVAGTVHLALNLAEAHLPVFAQPAIDIGSALAAFIVLRATRLLGVPRLRRAISRMVDVAQKVDQQFFPELATARTEQTTEDLLALTGDGLEAESPETLSGWITLFFTHGGASYTGVDSHLPGDYMREFRWYREIHAEAIEAAGVGARRDRRILVATRNTLTDDYLSSPESYTAFHKWHAERRVSAGWVHRDDVEKARKTFGLEHADVGLWERYAVLFQPHGKGVKIVMLFPGAADRHGLSYEKIQNFVRSLGEVTPLAPSPPGIDLVDEELADRWSAYVDAERRCDPAQPFAKWLLELLADRRFVLDAAAGIGCESVTLLKTGRHTVQTNEIDQRLAARALEFARSHDVQLDLTHHLWERLRHDARGNRLHEAILCLGNSLCLVSKKERRRECLRVFFELLVPGGVLLIDERNFEMMRRSRAGILEDPLRNFGPARRGDVMYGGHSVRGYPGEISDNEVIWNFFANDPPVDDSRELRARRLGGGGLRLHAFAHGELFAALRAAGFGRIDTYADLKLVSSDSMPARSALEGAEFLTYAAYKPTLVA